MNESMTNVEFFECSFGELSDKAKRNVLQMNNTKATKDYISNASADFDNGLIDLKVFWEILQECYCSIFLQDILQNSKDYCIPESLLPAE